MSLEVFPMPALFGPVLTNSRSAASFLDYYRAGRFSAAKVVTAWGIDGGWTPEARAAVVSSVPRLAVRSVSGDPSYKGASPFPKPQALVEEFRPWVALRPNVWLEIGNEPNVWGPSEFAWLYRYWLGQSITALRTAFPKAKLIAPAVLVGGNEWERWVRTMADTLRRCDSIGMHAYGWHRLLGPAEGETGQYQQAQKVYNDLFPNYTVAITEMGIHDPNLPKAEKLAHYRQVAREAPRRYTWALFYHCNERGDIQPEYDIPAWSID